jgi:sulfite reductase (NADPH) hemoprotein beta-component
MYRYDPYDQRLIEERVAQFRDQTRRYLAGALSEDEFRPLRLQNGLYRLRHATMLRVAVPYGLASSAQLRRVASLARRYQLGDIHLTTRQNIQFNGPEIADVPAILDELAQVQLHAIQTSGSCIRSITSDHLAGAAADEQVDPRPWAELLRQWSSLHPEFAHLPRKFKIAVSGALDDRALLLAHDLAFEARRDAQGEVGFRVLVGGGLGRWPILAQELEPFLPWQHLLTHTEAVLRVYNQLGRRDDLHKTRIKVLVRTLGIAAFRKLVEEEWARLEAGPGTLTEAEVARVASHFGAPDFELLSGPEICYRRALAGNPDFAAWVRHNVRAHREPGYAIVTLSTKRPGVAPGDLSPEQLDQVAQWAEDFSFSEVRVSHHQNIVLAHVRERDLHSLWSEVNAAGLGGANAGLLTDIIACPGGRYCDLASTQTAPLAAAIQRRFADSGELEAIGRLDLNLSGCINGCAHHAVGHIGIRGVEKAGASQFQISIGGDKGQGARLGAVIGPALPEAEVPDAIAALLATYRRYRQDEERFIDTVRRIGSEPFRQDLFNPHADAKVAHG